MAELLTLSDALMTDTPEISPSARQVDTGAHMAFPDPLEPHGPRSQWPLRLEAFAIGALMLFAALSGLVSLFD